MCMGKHPKLAAAPPALSVVSLCFYLSIWSGTTLSLYAEFGPPRTLTAVMCLVYAAESLLALLFGRSTMASWRRIDFQLHHLPYATCVGGSLVFELPIFEHYRWTMPLTLLTSLNEAAAAGYAIGAPRSVLERPNRCYLLLLMLVLIPTEVCETVRCLLAPGGPGLVMGAFAVSTIPGAAYHTFGVLPVCWKRVMGDKSADFAPPSDKRRVSRSPQERTKRISRRGTSSHERTP